VAVTF